MRDSCPKISAARSVLEHCLRQRRALIRIGAHRLQGHARARLVARVTGRAVRVEDVLARRRELLVDGEGEFRRLLGPQVLLEPLNGQIGVVGKMVRRHAGRGERSGRRGGASVSGWSLDESNSEGNRQEGSDTQSARLLHMGL